MIGDIIREQRALQNMSRKALSDGICTEKYVYLIENNQRNPSAYILNSFSGRLGIDLFEYYQYLNYKDKQSVAKYKENFERHIKAGDINKLKEESLKAAELEDFKQPPLSYDIKIIDLAYKSLVEGETSQVIKELKDILKDEKLNMDNLTLINAYIVLSTCYQIEEKFDKAKEAVELAYHMIIDKTEFSRYTTSIITVSISRLALLYNEKEYDKLIKYGNKLRDFQERYSEYNRIYYLDFYLAIAYYKTNQPLEAKEHFMRGLHSALLFKSELDMRIIAEMKEFSEIATKLDINEYLIEQYYQACELTGNFKP